MAGADYTPKFERILEEGRPESFLEAETILREENYNFNLVGNGSRKVEGDDREVFIYELEGSNTPGFYLYESGEYIEGKISENTRN